MIEHSEVYITPPSPLYVCEKVSVKVRRFSWRMNARILDGFKELCRADGLRPSEAVEEFMRLTLQAGSVGDALDAASRGLSSAQEGLRDQAEVLLARLREGKGWIALNTERSLSVTGRLFQLLGRIQDAGVRQRIREALEVKKG